MAKKPTKKSSPKKRAPSLAVFNDKQFQKEDDLRTIRRAEEIKTDPSRMKGVRTLAKQEVKALKNISKKA